MTADMPCDCKHPKYGHEGRTYACRTCGCKRYTPDIQEGSTSAQLRQAQTALAASQADLTRVERELEIAKTRSVMTLRQERDAQVKLRHRLISAEAELVSARAELEQLRAQLADRGAP